MVITGCALTLKCCSERLGPAAETTEQSNKLGTTRPAVFNCHCVGTARRTFIGRSLRARKFSRAIPLFAGTPSLGSPARLHYPVLRLRFFHTTQSACQRRRGP